MIHRLYSYTYKTNPEELITTWASRVCKDEMDKFLLPFGYGDGGGGPSRDFIEFAERQENLEGSPRVNMANPIELFEDLEQDGGPQHKYVGELYFSAHRGTYTSQARVKKGNRKSEFAMREAEMWASVAALQGENYPKAELDAEWKKVLLNQFHDILPGSSIARVYDKASALHDEVIAKAGEIVSASAAAIAKVGKNISVFNSLSWERRAVVEVPEKSIAALVTLPPCGYLVIEPNTVTQTERGAAAKFDGTTAVLENAKVKATFNASGQLISFVLKETGREFANGAMNKFRMYKDVPRLFDAWDIDSNYELQEISLDTNAEVEVIANSPLRSAIRVKKQIGNSELSQIISLEVESTRVEFDTTVNWRELHRLLKVCFPVNVRANEMINEIQFGYVKRPAHRSRHFDKDRFEVCNHKYTAMCDFSHGAAVLNDCKYGVSALDGTIGLTLLKAAGAPEMRADNREHSFKYAFTAWESSFGEADVVRQGYELNVPVVIANGGEKSESFFEVDKPNIIIDTVKLAEDGSGDVIVRMYEAKNAGTVANLSCGFKFESASLCEMNERVIEPAEIRDEKIKLSFGPFQVRTLIFRLQ